MKEIVGDIWDFHEQGKWIVITTNGTIKANGELVMGKGIALQARQRYPDIPKTLGSYIKEYGTRVALDGQHGLIFFPTKYDWRKASDLKLIEVSACELTEQLELVKGYPTPIYMPRPGCGNGGLNWEDVKPVLEKYLDDRFVVVSKGSKDDY